MTGLKLAPIRVAGCEQRFHRECVVAGTAPWPAGRAVQRGGRWTHTACPLTPTGAAHACLHCIWMDGGTSALANQPGGAQRGSLPGPQSQQVETTSLEPGSQPPDSEGYSTVEGHLGPPRRIECERGREPGHSACAPCRQAASVETGPSRACTPRPCPFPMLDSFWVFLSNDSNYCMKRSCLTPKFRLSQRPLVRAFSINYCFCLFLTAEDFSRFLIFIYIIIFIMKEKSWVQQMLNISLWVFNHLISQALGDEEVTEKGHRCHFLAITTSFSNPFH